MIETNALTDILMIILLGAVATAVILACVVLVVSIYQGIRDEFGDR